MTQIQGNHTESHEQVEVAEDKITNALIFSKIDSLDVELREINLKIHSQPELCYDEHHAHANITKFISKYPSIRCIPHAYNLPTSFSAEFGTGGRLVTFCAEYDALPGIGHACGHNLIATSSLAAFLGTVDALKTSNLPGRVRLLGTPAEEGGGGKIKLIEAGAFAGVDAALMAHPTPPGGRASAGVAYGSCLAGSRFTVAFTGKAAHAGAMPWLGVNALDAATLAYSAVSMLRQQIKASDRINLIIKEGGESSNVIAKSSLVEVSVRAATMKEMQTLQDRVFCCFEGAALATGCTVQITPLMDPYAELRPNETLCVEFTKTMASLGSEFYCDLKEKDIGGYGTDMGNVSYVVPSFHGNFCVPIREGENIHSAGFTRAAGAIEAYNVAMGVAKGMAVTAWKILSDDRVAKAMKEDFERDLLLR